MIDEVVAAPSMAQVSESQTRMVSGAISGSPSFTTSKCA
jgi:hypothetical protein